jgi:transcriptional regulator of arginine metabolism
MHQIEYLYDQRASRSTQIDEWPVHEYTEIVYPDTARFQGDPMKTRRQGLILELIDHESLHSQEEVRRRLRRRGCEATQATISRDIKELGLVKHPGDRAYQRPGVEVASPQMALSALERASATFLRRIDRVQQLVVVRTDVGQAQPLALAIDRAQLPEAIGTIAGDDTILIIARDGRRAVALVKRFETYAGL